MPDRGETEGRPEEEIQTILTRERAARREAERYSQELQEQATRLQEQAAEMEALNEELSASRARLQATMDSSLDAIISIDDSSRILEWNEHAETLFGWSAREAVGRVLTETIIPPEYHEAHLRGIEHYRATGEGPILNRRIEITARRRNGEVFPVELTVAPGGGGSRTFFTAFVRDLTDRERQAQLAEAQHAVTRVLAESHTLEEAAPRVLEAMGKALAWKIGAFWVPDGKREVLRSLTLWHAPGIDAPEFAEATREAAFASGMGLPGRVWDRQAPAWIEDAARDENFPRAEVAAREGLHGAFGFPILSGDEVLGVIEFFHPKVLQPDEALLRTVEIIGRDIAESIKRVRAEEEALRMRAELERVNEHLQIANVELEERTREAESASRAKSEFLANMSHELRTPLNAITGYTELLTEEIAGPVTEKQKAQLTRIQASSTHLVRLIDEILDLAKIESGRSEVQLRPIGVADALESAFSLIDPLAREKGLEFVDECGAEASRQLIGDADRVRQILVNLLSNAVKFTERGGRIVVRCDSDDNAGAPEAPGSADPRVHIHIEDTGRGIPADELESIFEPFTQVEAGLTRTWGGTGLGLAIARRFARLMDGDVIVRSELGRGSCFTLIMPLAARQSETPVPAKG